jgi:Tfp pilus assembly protein PilF
MKAAAKKARASKKSPVVKEKPAERIQPQFRSETLIWPLLILLTLATYWPVRSHQFIYYDDPAFTTQNPDIQRGLTWQTVVYAFSNPIAGNWHPLTTLSHALDCQFFGIKPMAHHLVNVLIHALNAALLFLVLRSLTGAIWRSALVAAIFALHPLRVESVAWVAERKDLLSGFFFLLTLWAYSGYVKIGMQRSQEKEPLRTQQRNLSWALYFGSLFCFALGLMSKPMVVTLPFVLLLLDYWPLRRFDWTQLLPKSKILSSVILEKVPYLLLSLGLCVITLIMQRRAGATEVVRNLTWSERLGNALASYMKYLGKLVWPAKLAIIYPHPAEHYYISDRWPVWEIALAGLLLVLVSILFFRMRARRPYLVVGWFWYLGMLTPVIGFIQVGEQAMADRYTYLPLIGPVISLVWWAFEQVSSRFGKPILNAAVATAIAVVVLLICLTRHQLDFWTNTTTLFEHAVAVTADNPSAQFGVGMGLLEERQPAKAMVRFRVAVAIDPAYERAHYIMAQLLRMLGHLQASADQYLAALRVNPSDVRAQVNLAGVLPLLGRGKEAAHQLDQVLRNHPDSVEALNNFAWLLATSPDRQVRDGTRALQFAKRACDLTNFKQAAFIGTLAAAYAENGRFPEAIDTAQRAAAVASSSGDEALAKMNQDLINLYRAGKPYRDRSQFKQEPLTAP